MSKPKTMADELLATMFPNPKRTQNAAMRVTDARLFNDDGSLKSPEELVAGIERRKREYPLD